MSAMLSDGHAQAVQKRLRIWYEGGGDGSDTRLIDSANAGYHAILTVGGRKLSSVFCKSRFGFGWADPCRGSLKDDNDSHDLQKIPKLFTRHCLAHIDKKGMRSYSSQIEDGTA